MNKCLLEHNKDNWETPDNIFNYLNDIFDFTLDPASDDFNYKCKKHYTYKSFNDNGLVNSWKGETVFCNPPYGKLIHDWILKGYTEFKENNVLSVFLIPARTDTKYFHRYILNKADIVFLRGRITFKGAKYPAPFPSMLVIYSNTHWLNQLQIDKEKGLIYYE